MKIKSIDLNWFRGASSVSLPLNTRSAIVYGPNGSGKSTFADALELTVQDRVDHLTHEYARGFPGRGLINTHAPEGSNGGFVLKLDGEKTVSADISAQGRVEWTFAPTDYEPVRGGLPIAILRQGEISKFINQDKSERYSQLVPLLNLQDYSAAAS